MEIHETLRDLAVPIDTVVPYKDNPRRGNVDAILRSLKVNGQYRPIVANRKDGVILAGNHTWTAAKKLDWPQIAVTFVDVDEDDARRIVLADNRANDLASYEDEVLADVLQAVAGDNTGVGFEGTGYTDDDLQDLLAQIEYVNDVGMDDVLDEVGPLLGNEGNESIRLDVSPGTANEWKKHRSSFTSDEEALSALLGS